MTNNLDDIQNGKYNELSSRDIEKRPVYGKVVIQHVPDDKVVIIDKDEITIVKGDKIIRVDGNMDIKTSGDLKVSANNITILPRGTNENIVEGLLSYSKLVTVLQAALGNFGSPIQYPTGLSEEVLTFDNIKIGN